jgi:hypothetical protein
MESVNKKAKETEGLFDFKQKANGGKGNGN